MVQRTTASRKQADRSKPTQGAQASQSTKPATISDTVFSIALRETLEKFDDIQVKQILDQSGTKNHGHFSMFRHGHKDVRGTTIQKMYWALASVSPDAYTYLINRLHELLETQRPTTKIRKQPVSTTRKFASFLRRFMEREGITYAEMRLKAQTITNIDDEALQDIYYGKRDPAWEEVIELSSLIFDQNGRLIPAIEIWQSYIDPSTDPSVTPPKD